MSRKVVLYTVVIALACLLLGVLGYAGYRYYQLSQAYIDTDASLASTTTALLKVQEENAALTNMLSTEQGRNTEFQSQLTGIVKTVGVLTKLAQTDKELLQKYSKVYFLNENYVPSSLSDIPSEYVLEPSRTYRIHSKVLPFLEHMLEDASTSESSIRVLSSYRSFGEQADLKASYKVNYGSGANRFSADQGYSEHQLGTAVDFTTTKLGTTATTFASTDAGVWLKNNAYKYGFILSYPKSNTYYQYEPWHWRFVGVPLATYIHEHGTPFYELDQRFIDTYLATIFDG